MLVAVATRAPSTLFYQDVKIGIGASPLFHRGGDERLEAAAEHMRAKAQGRMAETG